MKKWKDYYVSSREVCRAINFYLKKKRGLKVNTKFGIETVYANTHVPSVWVKIKIEKINMIKKYCVKFDKCL